MQSRHVKRYLGLLSPWCVLVLGLVATAVGTYIAMDAGREEVRESVARDADRIVASIATRIHIHEQMLTGVAALFAASDYVTREEWRAYLSVQNLDERSPDIASVGFAELVEEGRLQAHEAKIRGEGWLDYAVRPAGERTRYLPLTFSEPDETRDQIGFDLHTDPVLGRAAERAIAGMRPAMSEKLASAGGPGGPGQLTMYAPAARGGKVLGLAVAALRVDVLMSLLPLPGANELAIRVYDGAAPEAGGLLFDGAPGLARVAGALALTRPFVVGGRVWSIEVLAGDRLPGPNTRLMPTLVALAGVVIAYLAYLAARMLLRARMGERRFRDYAEMATDWLWEHDRDLRFTFISTASARRAAIAAGALGKTRREIAERLGDSEELEALARFEALMRAGKPFTGYEYSIRSRSGNREYFRISAKPLLAPNGDIAGYRGVTQVITGEKRRERELRDAKSVAEAASASKSRFLAMMSHELRTPLNAIIGFSDVIADLRFGRGAVERYAEYARIINRSGQQLLDLISQLLDMSKIEAGRLELVPEPVDLVEIARDCMKLLNDRAEAGGVTLRETFAAPALMLTADRRALRQVALNLVSNAVKFTPKGGRVTLALCEDGDGAAVFSVTDTGIGIAPEAMARIFQPFHQADATIARRFGGTGLGLAISRALVEAHGGRLTMASTVGQGTTATVRFPPARSLRGEQGTGSPQRMFASVAD
ncbi:MAG: CHASE domain-containing protein [Alphaproteobacteria bacterium]|nr:CHASE domain-containing protein [Alphaproteobacteria bacterium]